MMSKKKTLPKKQIQTAFPLIDIITQLPAKETVDVINNIVDYKKTLEEEMTKRLEIEKRYSESIAKLEEVSQFLHTVIHQKGEENRQKINLAFIVLEKLLEKDQTDQAAEIIKALILSESNYLDETTQEIVQSILTINNLTYQKEENRDYITIESLEDQL
ncbi:hypothetical protein [Persephonella sp.]